MSVNGFACLQDCMKYRHRVFGETGCRIQFPRFTTISPTLKQLARSFNFQRQFMAYKEAKPYSLVSIIALPSVVAWEVKPTVRYHPWEDKEL